MKKKNKLITLLLSAVMVAAAVPAMAFAGVAPEPVNVNISMEKDNYYHFIPQDVELDPALSDDYGYVDQVKDGPSVLDALIQAHIMSFGSKFSPETKDNFLIVDENGIISTAMGKETSSFGFLVNGLCPSDGVLDSYGQYTLYTVNQAKLNAGDKVQFFFYNPKGYFSEIYGRFTYGEKHVQEIHVAPEEDFTLRAEGYAIVYEGNNPKLKWKPIQGMKVCTLVTNGDEAGTLKPIEGAITKDKDEDGLGGGEVTLKFNEEGTYYIALTSDPDSITFIIPEICKVVVENPAPPVTPDTDKPVPADPADKPDGKAPVTDKTDAPKTGDTNNFMAYGLVALLAGATLTAAYRRKENR